MGYDIERRLAEPDRHRTTVGKSTLFIGKAHDLQRVPGGYVVFILGSVGLFANLAVIAATRSPARGNAFSRRSPIFQGRLIGRHLFWRRDRQV